jgi:thioredoxin-related protein
MLFGDTVAVYCENNTEHTDTVRTSQETHYVSATETNRLMLFGETVAVYCENNTEHTDTVRTSQETYGTHRYSPYQTRTIRNTQIHCVGRM